MGATPVPSLQGKGPGAGAERAVARSLEAADFPVEGLERWGQLTLIDADQLLSRFMRNDLPDPALFRTVVGDVIEKARTGGRHPEVRVYGEMVNLLWRWNLAAATRLEELWNEVIQAHSVSLFCAYSLDKRDPDAPGQFPPAPRTLHTHLIPVEAGAQDPSS